ncbi:Nucleolar 27S pre-rRNA processing protein [Ophiocordyceps camponoti-floridani]|uniref:Nucleolar 27S pre-rRNA processing protein n=1 Tax=Ophiocordyceps camponoti-floridani TaxID=2030778 RepID=A0A8H4VDU1_9HYPO|nr:Nucleolar 27S pre-rRNA processing protein [Ophiocordyceps camponoti-floridani]
MTDLVKTVRAIDQTGAGENGENLQHLWSCLTASSGRHFHAAEESTLRWLLKAMNEASAAAETVRRYPLTWTILACVFQRVPLFSLAKSLADRKFVAVLQQTFKEISKPVSGSSSPASSKRKRNSTVGYDLSQLQARQGCLETATEAFKALELLLGRLESSEEAFSRHRMGVEHIKSLLCTSAAEAVKIVAPALAICELLISESSEQLEGSESWINIISMVWDLHLQADNDTVEVATHLFPPSAMILARIGDLPYDSEVDVPQLLKCKWSADLRLFMQKNLIVPCKKDFVRQKSFEPLARAMNASKNIIQYSAPALYFLCSDDSGAISKGELRKENVEWLRRTFKTVELAIAERSDRNAIMQTILDRAIQRLASVDTDDLRRVCRGYALHESETDWALLSKAMTCDADILQVTDEGVSLRADVCDRILRAESGSATDGAISVIMGAIIDGYRTRRSLDSFLQLWFEQLSREERQRNGEPLLWSKVGRLPNSTPALCSFLEAELSPTQLLGVISWVEAQTTESQPQSLCIFASTITSALRSEVFVDAVGRSLLDLVAAVDGSQPAAALKWRVVSQTMNWTAPGERIDIWNSFKKPLSKILKKSPIVSSATFEAFKYCFQAWDCLSLTAQADEPALLIESFSKRLAAQEFGPLVLDRSRLPFTEASAKADFQEDNALQHYLMWCAFGSSRFSKLHFARKGDLPPVLSKALTITDTGVEHVEFLWDALLCNEINLNDAQLAATLVNRLVTALDGSVEAKSTGPGEQSLIWIKMLTRIPIEVFSRGQREQLMRVFNRLRARMAEPSNRTTPHAWKMTLSLASKMMRRPTFYQGMSFSDLVDLAAAVSKISVDGSTDCETILELIQRYLSVASATIRQMADHLDERGIQYFLGASKFVSDCSTRLRTEADANTSGLGLSMTLLQTLHGELSRTSNVRAHEALASLTDESKEVLSRCISVTVSKFVSGKKLLSSSSSAAAINLLAALDAASVFESFEGLLEPTSSAMRELDERTKEQMQQGDLKAWKIQAFLQAHLSATGAVSRPTKMVSLAKLPSKLQQPLLKELIASTTKHMSSDERRQFLGELIDELGKGWDTDGQILAIQTIVEQLTDSNDQHDKTDAFSLAAAHSQLTLSLLQLPKSQQAVQICHVLQTLLENRPQAMGQWNIELTLSTVCDLSSTSSYEPSLSFTSLCKLVEVVIKKHRLRLEGHYHILLSALQALLRNLIIKQSASPCLETTPEAKAQAYARLISLICEPTAGAVSRTQLHGALESATDAAKRSASRHMYLVMMQYVKLQLEKSVPKVTREALEPAMNAIFDITPPEVRKILNDAVQGGGRAILREMFRRYVKFGKWSGV